MVRKQQAIDAANAVLDACPDAGTKGIASAIVNLYIKTLGDEARPLIAVEQAFAVRIPDVPAVLVGLFDEVLANGVGDIKTTSSDITDIGGLFWASKVGCIDGQSGAYMAARHLMGQTGRAFHWTALKKPGLRESAIAKGTRSVDTTGTQVELTTCSSYYGVAVTAEQVEKAISTGREDATLLSYRMAATMMENPYGYAQRRVVVWTDTDLLEAIRELQIVAREIVAACHDIYPLPRCSAACTSFGRLCSFYQLCSRQETYDADQPANYRKKSPSPRPIPVPEHLADLCRISASEIATWHRCRREWYYSYGLGIERKQVADSALEVGSLVHAAIEQYNTILYLQKGNE